MAHIPIKIINTPTLRVVKEINHLLAQLSLTAIPPRPLTLRQLRTIIKQPNTLFISAYSDNRKNGKMIGFVFMYLIQIPSGLVAVFEDLIVDGPYRKWGVGRLLLEKGIAYAKKKMASYLILRTNPKRVEANKLYPQMGFTLAPTNVFRINFPRE